MVPNIPVPGMLRGVATEIVRLPPEKLPAIDVAAWVAASQGTPISSAGNAADFLDVAGPLLTRPAGERAAVELWHRLKYFERVENALARLESGLPVGGVSWSDITGTPTTLTGYGIIDDIVRTVAGRSGNVVLAASDISGLGGAALLDVGTTAGTVCAGDDSRLTGVPAAHASTHAFGGTDPVTLTTAQITGLDSNLTSIFSTLSSITTALAGKEPTLPTGTDVGLFRDGSGNWILHTASEIRTFLGLGGAALLNVGTTAGTVAAGNDGRFSDARTPTTHASTHASGGTDAITIAESQVTGLTADLAAKEPTLPTGSDKALVRDGSGNWFLRTASSFKTWLVLVAADISGLGGAATLNVGTTAGTVAAGNDSRLSNARTPTAHASTHVVGGTDQLTLSQSQITGLSAALAAKEPTLPTGTSSTLTRDSLGAWVLLSGPGFKTFLAITASDVSGLGGAALLNVGTTGGTVAAGNDSRFKAGVLVCLCVGFTPTSLGADSAEIPVPYSRADGTTSAVWNVRRINLRVAIAGGAPAVTVEKSTVAGVFSAATVGTVTLGSGAYEGSVTSALGTVSSGDKLRFNTGAFGTAQAWSITVELGE